jgi:predicted GIY-YIG superfamily endonuclease
MSARNRNCGYEVDKRVRKKHGGKIWMSNPKDYVTMRTRIKFIDNTCGESIEFLAIPQSVIRGFGAPQYRSKKQGDAKRVHTHKTLSITARKFKSRSEFEKKAAGAYCAARKLGILDEVCKHMRLLGSAVSRALYIYLNEESRECYIGLSYNVGNRFEAHLNKGREEVQNLILAAGTEFKQLTPYMKHTEAARKEIEFIELYEKQGWDVLNACKGGGLGGQGVITY